MVVASWSSSPSSVGVYVLVKIHKSVTKTSALEKYCNTAFYISLFFGMTSAIPQLMEFPSTGGKKFRMSRNERHKQTYKENHTNTHLSSDVPDGGLSLQFPGRGGPSSGTATRSPQ